MKTFYVGALLCTGLLSVQAQDFTWAQRGGSWAYDYGYGITTDNAGNAYVAGKYEENAVFGSVVLPSQGNHDIFLAKYNAAGEVSWVASAGGTGGDYAHGVSCNGSSLYLTGEVEGTNTTVFFPGSPVTLTSISDNDIFLAKYDLNGSLLWARSAGGWRSEKALTVTHDPDGGAVIAGHYEDSCTFGGSTMITGSGAQDIFLAKYDANGNFLWVQRAGGPGRDEPKAVKCDAAGNIYMCGFYSPGCSFSGHNVNAPSGYYETFVCKYDKYGNLLWITTGGGDYDDVAWDMALGNNGNVYVSGEFNASAYFGSTQLITSGNADVYVAAYDANGNVLWARGAGGPLIDRARGMGTDGTNIFITGQFGATANFGSKSLTAADSSDIFFAGLDNNGNFTTALAVGGPADAVETLGYESGIDICADGSGNVFATGSTLDGGTFGSTLLQSYSRTDVFVTRISSLTGVKDHTLAEMGIRLYPNPSEGKFIFEPGELASKRVEMKVYNNMGEIVCTSRCGNLERTSIDLSSHACGVYYLELRVSDDKIYREKLVVNK